MLGVIHDERAPSASEVGRHLLIGVDRARGALRGLEGRGLVDRVYSDRPRGHGYTLTDEGEAAYQAAWPAEGGE